MRKSKMKRTVSLLLAILMVFMSINFSVFAQEVAPEIGIKAEESLKENEAPPLDVPEQTPPIKAPATPVIKEQAQPSAQVEAVNPKIEQQAVSVQVPGGETAEYATLKDAVEAAATIDGSVIEINADISLDSICAVDKNLTINGNGHKLTLTDAGTLGVKKQLTVNDLNIDGQNKDGYGAITVAADNAQLTTNNVVINRAAGTANDTYLKTTHGIQIDTEPGTGKASPKNTVIDLNNTQIILGGKNGRGICFAGESPGTKLTMEGSGIYLDQAWLNYDINGDAVPEVYKNGSFAYSRGIALFNPHDINVELKDSKIFGFAYGINSSGTQGDINNGKNQMVTIKNTQLANWAGYNIWSSSSTFKIEEGSIVKGINPFSSPSNDFSTITINDNIYGYTDAEGNPWPTAQMNTLIIEDSTVTNQSLGTNTQDLIRVDYENGAANINLKGDTKLINTTGNNVTKAFYIPKVRDKDAFLKDKVTVEDTVISKNADGTALPFYTDYFQVKVKTDNADQGSASIQADLVNKLIKKDAAFTVTATPKTSYDFEGWYNAKGQKIEGAGASYQATASEETAQLTAKFKPKATETLTLDKTTAALVLEKNATVQLTASRTPVDAGDTLLWESSDSNVASVNEEGLVTAHKAGSTTITAKAGNASAVCRISVNPDQVTLTPAAGGSKVFNSLQEAIVDEQASGGVITIPAGTYYQTSTVNINKPVTVKGVDGTILTRGDAWTKADTVIGQGEMASLILVTADAVTLENLTVSGAKRYDASDSTHANGHGINCVQADEVVLKNVTTKDNAAAGLVVNGSQVSAEGFYTSGNGWYGVNVDQGSGITEDTLFTLKAPCRLTETYQIFSDKYNTSDNINVELPSTFIQNSAGDAVYWNDASSLIKNQNTGATYPTIQAAIDAANRNNTLLIPAGTYTDNLNIKQSVTLKKAAADAETVLNGAITVVEGKKAVLEGLTAGENATLTVKDTASVVLIETTGFDTKGKITVEKVFGTDYDTSRVLINTQPAASENLSFTYLGEAINPDLLSRLAGETTYSVKTPAQFYWLSQQINSGAIVTTDKMTIKLSNDLDFKKDEWLPVGVKGHSYTGKFNGQDHTITGLNVNMPGKQHLGLFGQAWGASDLSNVHFEDVTITGSSYAGALAGLLGSSTVKNVSVNDITLKTGSYTGGIVGSGYSNLSNCTVNTVDIQTTGQNVGGILGFLGEGNFTIQDCTADNVNISEPYWDAGGLVGAMVYGNVKFYNNQVNNSKIKISANSNYRGELIGEMRGSDKYAANLYLYNCTSKNTTAINKNETEDKSQLVGGKQDLIKTLTVYNEDNKTPYETIQAAINAAKPGDTIIIGAGTYNETVDVSKAVNLIGVNAAINPNDTETPRQAEAVITGGIKITRTDKTDIPIEISGLKLVGGGILATGWQTPVNTPNLKNITIKNNVFDQISDGDGRAAIHFNTETALPAEDCIISQNRITNVIGKDASGITLSSVSGETSITGNYIENVNHGALQILDGAQAVTGALSITNNTFINWDAEKDENGNFAPTGGGRAINLGNFAKAETVDIHQNKMIREGLSLGRHMNQMLNIADSGSAAKIDASYNYWNGMLPLTVYGSALFNKDAVIVVGAGNGAVTNLPYYTDKEMTKPYAPVTVYDSKETEQKGMYITLQEAVNGAEAKDVIVLNGAEYSLKAPVEIDKALTIKAATGVTPVVIPAVNANAFTVTQDIAGDLTFDGVNIDAQKGYTNNNSASGLQISQKKVEGTVTYKNATIKGAYYGILVSVDSKEKKDQTVEHLIINQMNFDNNLHKSIYVENSNTIEITDSVFNGGANTGTPWWPTRVAVDINEKYNAYDTVTVEGCTFNNIVGPAADPTLPDQVGYAAALSVKARNDGNYADPAASLKNVSIRNNHFTENTCDVVLGEPGKDGTLREPLHPDNISSIEVTQNSFGSKVQNNYDTAVNAEKNYWGTVTPDFSTRISGNLGVYPYYTDEGRTNEYAPVILQKATTEEKEYTGTINDAYAKADTGDTIIINTTAEGSDAVINEDINMNQKAADLKLAGSTTFNGNFAGSTVSAFIMENGTTATFTKTDKDAIKYFTAVDVVNFDSTVETKVVAPAANTSQNSFIARDGVMSYQTVGENHIWIYGSPSNRFNGGDGTEEKPYQINTPEQLKLLQGMDTAKTYFKLTNDITVTDWTALSAFAGSLDGNGYTLTGNAVSFVEELSENAKIEKLHFEGFTNLAAANKGTIDNTYTLMGAGSPIVGKQEASGTLENSFTTGSALASDEAQNGSFKNSYYQAEASQAKARTTQAGTPKSRADMQKARFAIALNDKKTTGIWNYNAAPEASAYPFVVKDGGQAEIENFGKVSVSSDQTIGTVSADQPDDGLYLNDTVTLKASITDDKYDFKAWSINGTLLSSDMNTSYQVKSSDQVGQITASFTEKPTKNIMIATSGNGKVSIDGAPGVTFAQKESVIGKTVTLKALADSKDYKFVKWTTFKGDQVSLEETLQVRVGTEDLAYIAHFEAVKADEVTITFTNGITGLFMGTQTIAKGSNVKVPDQPTVVGQKFDGWYNGDTKMTVNDQGEIENVTGDLNLIAKFTPEAQFDIKVINGTIEGAEGTSIKKVMNEIVTVIADEAEAGKVFAGWKHEGIDNVVSYDKNYTFTVKNSVSLVATYSEEPVEMLPIVTLDPTVTQIAQDSSKLGQDDLWKLRFVTRIKVPENYTPIECGIVLKKDDVVNPDDISIGSPGVLKGSTKDISSDYYYGLTVSKLTNGQTVSARGYLTYMKNGETITIYSNMVKETVDYTKGTH